MEPRILDRRSHGQISQLLSPSPGRIQPTCQLIHKPSWLGHAPTGCALPCQFGEDDVVVRHSCVGFNPLHDRLTELIPDKRRCQQPSLTVTRLPERLGCGQEER